MYKRACGIYWASFKMPNGRRVRKSLGTKNKKLAQAIEAKIRTDIHEGKYFEKKPGERKTFKDMTDRFMAEHAPNVTISMQKSYICSLGTLTPFFGENATLNSIDSNRISRFKAKRQKDERKPATINRELAMLSKMFSIAVKEWKWLSYNPMKDVNRNKLNNERKRWLSLEEEVRLLSVCKKEWAPEWLHDVVIFDANTGLRAGELLSLEWSRVDLFRKTIFIDETKNHESRTIPLNKAPFDILVRRSKVKLINSKLVFFNNANKVIDINKLGKSFRRALKEAEIENFRFHDLRHTFGSRLAQSGVDINTIAKLMGHKDLKTTKRYIHHTTDSLRRVVDLLDSFGHISVTPTKQRVNQIG